MKLFLLLITILAGLNAAFAKTDFSAIDTYINAVKEEIGLPSGTAVAIIQDGKIVYEGYFGYADIKEDIKVNADTAFYLASVTKPVFALSVLLMENNGDIKSSTPLAELFPEVLFPDIDKNNIEVKHLLSHTHALGNRPLEDTLAFTGQHNKEQRKRMVAATTVDAAVKLGDFQYSNLGYNLLSVWAEEHFKQEWQQTIDELVYQPLSMKHTSSYTSDASKKGYEIARPYGLYGEDPTEVLPFEKSDSTMQAAGGMVSSARDMARFLIAQLNEGRVDGKQMFPAKVINKSHQKLAVNDLKYRDFKRNGYAWGWYIGPYKGEQMYHHFGGTAGTHTHTSFMLEHNIGLVVLNNESIVSSRMANGIADIAYTILLDKGDADAVANKHIEEMKVSWTAFEKHIEETVTSHQRRNASRVMDLTQEKSKYTGLFHNPLWGNLNVKLVEASDLEFTLGGLKAIATAAKKTDELRIQFPVMGGGKIASYKVIDDKVTAIDIYGINPLGVETFIRVEE